MITYDEAIQHIKENPRRGRNDSPMSVSMAGGRERYVWFGQHDGFVTVTLFDSCIAVIHADGSYTVDSCGYATATTRDALNVILPGMVGSERGLWWYRSFDWNGPRSPFRDGMRIWGDGRVSYDSAEDRQVLFDDPRSA